MKNKRMRNKTGIEYKNTKILYRKISSNHNQNKYEDE